MTTRVEVVRSPFDTPGAWSAMWLVVTAAIYGCVPETDHLPGIAVALAVLLLVELMTRHRLHGMANLAVAGVLVWAVFHGAAGRDRAIVGGLFAFWPVVIVWIVAVGHPGLMRRPEPVRWAVAACGGAAALIVSRTGALDPGWAPALRSIALWAPASLAAAALVAATTTPFGSPNR
jgi:hypothetical protein